MTALSGHEPQIKISIPAAASRLLGALRRAGFEAYVVGGCVRDSLLGRTPGDWDICTSARPEQVRTVFSAYRQILTGEKHGTVAVIVGGTPYEITTYRVDGQYHDSRHPDAVRFVPQVQPDLARRDFTINAMAYNAEEGLIDPFGGQKDLARGLVRAVGVPHQRFTEDALRILRLYRFAARFGFEIDPATGQAARELCAHLDCVSIERITEELTRLLASPKPGTWMEPAVFAVVLPELFTPENAPRFEAARAIIDTLPEGLPEVSARLAALLLPLGEQGTRKALKQLRCSNALIEEVTTLVREAGLVPEEKTAARAIQARRLLGRLEPDPLRRLLALCAAHRPEQAAAFAALQTAAGRLQAENACCRVGQLAVNGRDLMALGAKPGPGLRGQLEALLEAVITGQLPNERKALLAAVKIELDP